MMGRILSFRTSDHSLRVVSFLSAFVASFFPLTLDRLLSAFFLAHACSFVAPFMLSHLFSHLFVLPFDAFTQVVCRILPSVHLSDSMLPRFVVSRPASACFIVFDVSLLASTYFAQNVMCVLAVIVA
jgi:hypothetical protein